MDLGRLKRLIDALIDEQGEKAPVAVFLYTAADVADATSRLSSSDNHSQVNPADVLEELQTNAGEPPFEDQLLKALERFETNEELVKG